MRSEQSVLQLSIAVTIVVAGFGVTFGVLSGSFSIVFDGVYMLVDAAMSGLALLVTRLIALSALPEMPNKKLRERFTMGFWHLEPMVLGLNGILLVGVAIYAFINAIGSILVGGRELEFTYAILYAILSLVICCLMAVYETRANRRLNSDFIALDAKAWFMSAGITAALLVAFVIGYFIENTTLDWLAPYIDPVVLAIVCLAIIPLPIGTIRRALEDILLVTPAELKLHVDTIARQFVKEFGFVSYRAYVARVGRARQIELYFIVPDNFPAKKLEEWDAVRDRIGEALGDGGPDRWLTIVFTSDLEWAV